jgi:hypothetical protein
VAAAYDQEKSRIAASARNAPSIKDQGRHARDTAASQASSDGFAADGDRYGAHPR